MIFNFMQQLEVVLTLAMFIHFVSDELTLYCDIYTVDTISGSSYSYTRCDGEDCGRDDR